MKSVEQEKRALFLIAVIVQAIVVLSVPAVSVQGMPGELTTEAVPPEALPKSITPVISVTGQVSLSVDACGTNGASAIVQVEKPAGATVRSAYLCAASTGGYDRQLVAGDVMIDGVGVAWDLSTPSSIGSWNHWADVTALVSSKINAAPAGRVDFTITEVGTEGIDGEILAVIFDDPSQTDNTVALLFGAQNISGDDFFIGLAEPVDLSDTGLVIEMALGISYGYQTPSNYEQVSHIDVNGVRLTSSAGGQDDGASENGGLITVGGLDDSNGNPPPYGTPSGVGYSYDDELYDLRPIISDGTMLINVHTYNPSNDDNILFASFFLTVAGTVTEDAPPQFVPVGDLVCGDTIHATVGQEIAFTVRAEDNGPNDDNVLLASGPLPLGAMMAPLLPMWGNPAISAFSWTPDEGQVGSYTVVFDAADSLDNLTAQCAYTIIVADSSTGDDEVVPTNEWINVYCGVPELNGEPLEPGDIIRAYDPDGVLCGKDVVRFDGSFGFMPVYREEPYNEGDQGAEPGDLITFTVNGMEVQAYPEVYWTANGDAFEVCAFSTCQSFVLEPGWHLISWNRDWSGSVEEFPALLGESAQCVEIIMGFDQGAMTYDPDLPQYSTLRDLDYHFGYWFYLNCPVTFDVCGARIDPTDYIPVWPEWNLVSYWPQAEQPTTEALASVYDCLMVAIGFAGDALIHVPGDDPFNTLTAMGPGFGYWLKSECSGGLVYPGWTGPAPVARRAASEYEVAPSRTWMSIYGSNLTLDGAPLGEAIIDVYSAEGVRCGTGSYTDGLLKFTPVYGFDQSDEATVHYPKPGEVLSLTVNGQPVSSSLVWTSQGDRVRLSNLAAGGSGTRPEKFALLQNYPNPFNPSTTIRFTLPAAAKVKLEVINLLGQTVAVLADGPLGQGEHAVTWDASEMASGTYLYRLTAGGFVETRKMVLIR